MDCCWRLTSGSSSEQATNGPNSSYLLAAKVSLAQWSVGLTGVIDSIYLLSPLVAGRQTCSRMEDDGRPLARSFVRPLIR